MNEQASNLMAHEQAAAGGNAKATIPLAEAVLVEKCRAGDGEAFTLLIEQYQDRIYNLIWRMCGRAEDAEELAQETFLRAFERLDQFRGGSRFYTWLFRIAANLALSHRRRGRKVKFLSLSGTGEESGSDHADALIAGKAAQREDGPEAAAMQDETSQRIARALDQLDNEFRAVVVLRDIEDMDYGQIAKVLDLPVGTVKSRLHRARMLLKEKLADLVS